MKGTNGATITKKQIMSHDNINNEDEKLFYR